MTWKIDTCQFLMRGNVARESKGLSLKIKLYAHYSIFR